MPVPKGKRYGGKPKGYKHAPDPKRLIDKQVLRERALQIFQEHFEPMMLAQVEHAKGVGYMLVRRPDGTMSRATDQKQVDAALAAGGHMFQVMTAAPNTQAFMALWDRTLDKPIERVENTGKDGGPLEVIVRKPW